LVHPTDSVVEKAQQRLFNLRRLKEFGLSPKALSICGFDYRLKMARNKDLSSETRRQSILILRNEGYSM
jgi:hypothetical protein